MACRSASLILLLLAAAGSAHAAVLTVGAGESYATIPDAIAAASAGDTIDIYPGTYADQAAYITVPLTIQGVGGTPVLTATGPIGNGKGLLVIDADTTINNLEFSNAQVSDENGAGIRYEQGTLVVTNSQFINNQEGMLLTTNQGGSGSVLVESSYFNGNGESSGSEAGQTHAIYATPGLLSLTVEDSTFEGTNVGHDIKSRAANTVISGNMLDDGVTGTTSYAIDIPNGGVATVTGNTINQGPNTQNETMVEYGAEGLTWSDNSLLLAGNTFNNTLAGTSIGLYNHTTTVTAQVQCNAFNGVTNPTVGPANLQDNSINGPLPACAADNVLPEPPGWASMVPAGLLLALVLRRRVRPAG